MSRRPRLSVSVLAPSAEAAQAFDRQAKVMRPAALPPASLIRGELEGVNVDETAASFDVLARQATISGHSAMAGAAGAVGAAIRLPRLLETLHDPDAGKLDRGKATFTALSPILGHIETLKGPFEAVGVVFAWGDAWKILADGKLSSGDFIEPAVAAAKTAKAAGVRLPRSVDTMVVLLQIGGELFTSEHDVGHDDALRLAMALPPAIRTTAPSPQ